jgi:hypothetical protein
MSAMRRGGPITALFVLLCLAQGASAAVTTPAEEFCVSRVLHNYEPPFVDLPKVREPSRRLLPFGSSRLEFGPVPGEPNGQYLATQAEGIKFQFSLVVGPPKTLDWTVVSRLVRIDGEGNDRERGRRKLDHLGRLVPGVIHEVGFGRAGDIGLYRYDMTIRSRSGRVLARYGHYYRVASPNWNTQLVLNGTSFRPGEKLAAQIQNFGAYSLVYGDSFSIEREIGSGWTSVPLASLFGPNFVFSPILGFGVAPGESDACPTGFTVPEKMEPGRYRIVKEVKSGYGLGGITKIGAEFTVEPAV